MKVPLTWLREYVDFPSEEALAKKLTAIGYMQDGPIQDVAGDRVLDLEVRQNRADGLSLLGVAREVAAVFATELRQPTVTEVTPAAESSQLHIEIPDPQLCYRFNAIKIVGVKVAPSPQWLQDRLTAYGIKSINNIVDITNFVMVELGQPLHAFDADQITDETLIIRAARSGEEITVLGKRQIKLVEDDIVIADPKKVLSTIPIGGLHSGVSDQTTSIILETATYNQASIRRTSLRHNIRTEASTRLEKFLHPQQTEIALARALQLIKELAGGEVVAHVDAYPNRQELPQLTVRQSRLNRIAGFEIELDQAAILLERLEIPVLEKREDALVVSIPYFRTDLEQEDDIVEEILRLHGYDAIPERLPQLAPPKSLQSLAYTLEEKARDILVAAGYDEQITEPLTEEDTPQLDPVRLQNSLNTEKTMLRTTLEHSLVRVIKNRKRYRHSEIAVFEVGKIYFLAEGQFKEERVIGIAVTGTQASYMSIKGAMELVCNRLGYEYDAELVKVSVPEDGVFVAQLNLSRLLEKSVQVSTRVLTTPPQVLFQDFSFTVAEKVLVGDVIQEVKKVNELITTVTLGEEPRGKGENKKSIFLKVTFSSEHKTLSSEEVEPLRQEIVQVLQDTFQAEFA